MSYLNSGQFALIAHRGGTIFESEKKYENTIQAFQKTLELYPDGIFELDIQQTRDGEIILMHDLTVDRTTNGHGKVHELNYTEISKLDAGGGARVPRLQDVFENFPRSKISVEFKSSGFEEKAIQIIRKYNAQDRVVLAGFSQKILNQARRLAPEICSGSANWDVSFMVLASKTGLRPLAPGRGNVFQIPLERNGVAVYSKNFLNLAHRLNRHVHIWTINDEATMRRLLLDGVDGIITDSPQVLFNVARELKKI